MTPHPEADNVTPTDFVFLLYPLKGPGETLFRAMLPGIHFADENLSVK
jgi:hypothetical protein